MVDKVIRRGEAKIKNCLNLGHIYLYHIKDLDEDSKYYLNSKVFRDICVDYNTLMMSLIIEDGYFFKMPYRLGTLRIKKNKLKLDKHTLKPDFGLYKESGGKYKNKHLNEHSGGYYVRFYWNKINMIVVNKSAYSFIATRQNKRHLAKLVKEQGMNQVNKYFD